MGGALLFLFHPPGTTLNVAGDVIVSVLWRLNVCGAIMARLLLDSSEHDSFQWSTMQRYQKLCTKAVCIQAPFCNNIFVRICIFLSTLFEKKVWELFDPLKQLSHSSE